MGFFINILLLFGTSRGGAVAARKAHNLEVGGSNPSPATKIILFGSEIFTIHISVAYMDFVIIANAFFPF